MNKTFLWGILPVVLSGCSWLEPDFALPLIGHEPVAVTSAGAPEFVSPTVVGSWQVVQPEDMTVADGAPWYTALNLPGLDALMADAMAGNPDLQAMAGRVTQARATAGISLAAQLPTVAAGAEISRQRLAPSQLSLPQGSSSSPVTAYGTGLSASFEPDLFGRLSGETRTSKLLALTEEELYRNVKLMLEADVARAYVQVKATHDVLDAWKALLADAEERHRVLDLRYKAGELSLSDWQASLAGLQNVRVSALEAASAEVRARNALAVLVGKVPQELTVPSEVFASAWKMPTAVPQGISSTVLLRRPDVLAAAYQLEAANAQIGVARAAFFPRLTLTADGGFATTDFSNLFDWNNRTWAVGPVLSLPIFQGGALRANLRRSWGQYEQGVALYRGQVLGAFRDVGDSLADAHASRLQADSLNQAMVAMQSAERAMAARYDLGDAGKLELLTARIETRQAEMARVQAVASAYAGNIRLVQALGGTW